MEQKEERDVKRQSYPSYHNQPFRLTTEEMEDPMLVLNDFFAAYRLPELRAALNLLLQDGLRATESEASAHMSTSDDMEKLVEAAWLLHQANKDNGRTKILDSLPLQAVVDLIIVAMKPEAIFLLDEVVPDLLIVLPDTLQTPFTAWQDMIQALAAGISTFNFSLHKFAELERQVRDGYPFYVFACVQQALVYQREDFILPMPSPALVAGMQQKSTQQFKAGMNRAKSFLKGAQMYMQAEDWVLAAFMLHQSLEVTCRAIIMAFYDHDPRTHSIIELKKQCRRICPAVNAQLPGGNIDEERLLDLLEKVYVQARYNRAFEVSARDTHVLFDRVGRIIQISQACFDSKIHDYKTI